jgi:hypothetical protein
MVDGSQGSSPWVFIILGILAQIVLIQFTGVEERGAVLMKNWAYQFKLVFSSLIGVARDIEINILAGLLLPS